MNDEKYTGIQWGLSVDVIDPIEPLRVEQLTADRIWEQEESKERFLRAFLAETGLKPTECEMLIETTFTGQKISFRKRGNHNLYGKIS
jgi:hypothetical protein